MAPTTKASTRKASTRKASTKKTSTKKASARKASAAKSGTASRTLDSARKHFEDTERAVRRVSKSLDDALADLTKAGASRSGSDIRRDLA
ncbi:MAG: hypothetical protein JWM29_1789, partial [Solirubrobacterales bacterium]|nr:hypothetical protein [Solirubrobacterales bacterium]